jgi:hypothetical protein
MAVTQNSFTGNGSTTNFSFTFPYIKTADVKAKIDGVNTTAFTLANATTVSFTTAPSNGANVIIFRDTDNDEKTATFFAGSAVKAEDLNNNFDQVLFTAQEVDNNALQTLGGTMSGDLNFGQNADIVFEGQTDNANETTLTVTDPTADRTITLPDVTGTVVTTGDTGTVATGMIADSAITSAKISDGTIATGDIADDAVTTAKIADANVTTASLADTSVTTAKLASDAVTTAKITDANVTTAKIANDAITAAKIAADAVGSSEIAANAVTSSELADASVDTAAIVDANVTTAKVADSAITTAKINDSAITSAKIGANQVVEGKIADNAVTTSKIPDSGVTTPKIADNAVTNVKLADAELRELATMGSTTASALADLTQAEVQILDGATVSTNELNILDGVTANATEINQLDGNTLTNSFTASSTTQYPSSNAISGYVLGLMDNLGGFVAIANENSFPTTNPDPSDDAGTVVSISDAGGLVVSASGTASGQTTGGTAVTITGFPSALQSSTLPAGQGLQVVSTSTLNTYTYHKVLGTDADIAQLNDDVNDFFARYRIGSTNPTTDLDAGDLFFNTSTGKMLVYDATVTAWEEVQAVGNYFINTLSSSGGTGGGSATFNGSAYRFTLSNPGSVAQQHIVSINGVIQKPNSGTSQPSEGFAIDNADIILAAAPATGSEFFIVTVGTSVNIGTPSNNTINNAMVKADAAIAGTKISPDFGSQNVVTTGNVGIGDTSPSAKLEIRGASTVGTNTGHIVLSGDSAIVGQGPQIVFSESGSGSSVAGAYIGHGREGSNSIGFLSFGTRSSSDANDTPAERMRINSSGNVGIGTSSPSRALHVNSGATNEVARFESSDTEVTLELKDSTGTAFLKCRNDYRFGNNSGELVRIDSSGNVGIGTSSPATDFHIHRSGGSSNSEILLTNGDTGATATDGFKIALNSGEGGEIWNYENDYIRFGTNNTEVVRIDNSGNVGIGTSSPGARLEVVGSNAANNLVVSAGNTDFAVYNNDSTGEVRLVAEDGSTNNNSKFLTLYTQASGVSSPTERMRIDSSGNVGIGESSPDAKLHILDSTDGGLGDTRAAIRFSRRNGGSNDAILYTVHNGADGVMALRLDVEGGERMRFTNNGLTFNGDTASANALDDYEEGTWSSTVNGITASTNSVTGIYTKVGNAVFIAGFVNIAGKSAGSGNVNFQLPFSAKQTTTEQYGMQITRNTIDTSYPFVAPYNGGASCFFYSQSMGAMTGSIMGNGVIAFNGSYITNT